MTDNANKDDDDDAVDDDDSDGRDSDNDSDDDLVIRLTLKTNNCNNDDIEYQNVNALRCYSPTAS